VLVEQLATVERGEPEQFPQYEIGFDIGSRQPVRFQSANFFGNLRQRHEVGGLLTR
jgi:hypothetical protein